MKKSIDPLHYDAINVLYSEGTSISSIAKEYCVSRKSIYGVLRREFGYEFKAGEPKHKNRIGEKFGYLIIKSFTQNEKSTKEWRAICVCTNCGNDQFETSIQNILRGLVTSCGCRRDQYSKISGSNNVNWTGCGELRGQVWSCWRRRAKKRGQEFTVTIEEAWDLYIAQDKKCALTGMPIYFSILTKSKKGMTASLDRIDSDKGYTLENIQWLHKDVNVIKNAFSQEYFINICRLISNNKQLDIIETVDILEVEKLKKRYFGDKRKCQK